MINEIKNRDVTETSLCCTLQSKLSGVVLGTKLKEK